jgi:PAS domain S-box-containing protein
MYEAIELASALFKAVRAGIVIVDADSKLIIDINPAASIMIGVSREKAVGKPCKRYLCADDCDGCPVMTANLYDGIEEVEDKDIVLYRDDGSIVYAWLTISSIVLNNKRLFINTLIDITKQRHVEFRLKEYWDNASKILTENVTRLKTGAI